MVVYIYTVWFEVTPRKSDFLGSEWIKDEHSQAQCICQMWMGDDSNDGDDYDDDRDDDDSDDLYTDDDDEDDGGGVDDDV